MNGVLFVGGPLHGRRLFLADAGEAGYVEHEGEARLTYQPRWVVGAAPGMRRRLRVMVYDDGVVRSRMSELLVHALLGEVRGAEDLSHPLGAPVWVKRR